MIAVKVVREMVKYVNLGLQTIFVTIYATVLQQFWILVADMVELWLQKFCCNHCRETSLSLYYFLFLNLVTHPGLLCLWSDNIGDRVNKLRWALFVHSILPSVTDIREWTLLEEDILVTTASLYFLYVSAYCWSGKVAWTVTLGEEGRLIFLKKLLEIFLILFSGITPILKWGDEAKKNDVNYCIIIWSF